MEAKELRIGNYVEKKYEPFYEDSEYDVIKVDLTEISGVHIFHENPIRKTPTYRPIPLSEHWLIDLDCGYVPKGNDYGYVEVRGVTFYFIDSEEHFMQLAYGIAPLANLKKECKYVHQWQNLYFALCGKELIKQS